MSAATGPPASHGTATGPDADPLDHADRDAMVPAEPGTLADQQDLVDAEGDDIREYTGEPVETDEGWVVPQTQNSGDTEGS